MWLFRKLREIEWMVSLWSMATSSGLFWLVVSVVVAMLTAAWATLYSFASWINTFGVGGWILAVFAAVFVCALVVWMVARAWYSILVLNDRRNTSASGAASAEHEIDDSSGYVGVMRENQRLLTEALDRLEKYRKIPEEFQEANRRSRKIVSEAKTTSKNASQSVLQWGKVIVFERCLALLNSESATRVLDSSRALDTRVDAADEIMQGVRYQVGLLQGGSQLLELIDKDSNNKLDSEHEKRQDEIDNTRDVLMFRKALLAELTVLNARTILTKGRDEAVQKFISNTQFRVLD